jgi:alkyl hydroperoxide reductase subunit AhpC
VLASDPADLFELPRSEALPVTYIIDNRGKVREQLMGEQTAAGVMAKLEALQAKN